jgi:hypothetical protein
LKAASLGTVNERAFDRGHAPNLLRASGAGPALVAHCNAVAAVALRIGRVAQRDHLTSTSASSSSTPCCTTSARHELSRSITPHWGGQIIRSARTSIADDDLRERLARVVEVHTGAGLSRETVRALNAERGLRIPERDYTPEIPEEIIVALADKLVAGERELSFDAQLEDTRRKFGPDSQIVRQLEAWYSRYGKYLDQRDELAAASPRCRPRRPSGHGSTIGRP